MMFEGDLVRVQDQTGAELVQRTAVLDVVRAVLVGKAIVIHHGGRHHRRGPASLPTSWPLGAH
jgi:hypothetical protein